MALTTSGMCPLMQVFDMPTSLRFYCDVLGFSVHQAAPEPPDSDWVWLKRGDIDLMLNTMFEREHRPAQPPETRAVGHEDLCLYIGSPDVDGAYAHLTSMGWPAEPPAVQAYGMKQVYLRDPDGYGICFQWSAAPGEGR